jgi:alkylhydroperoxidase/carboxymuconolactone decarboxylase family protein YurZ
MVNLIRVGEVKDLPPSLQDFIQKYPKVWESYNTLGEACVKAGPLEAKYVELIKIAIYATKGMFTPLKTHVRWALKFGATSQEIYHTILQLLTADGISQVSMAMKWANEVISDEVKKG